MANTGQPPPGVAQPSHTSTTPPLTKSFSSILNPNTKPPTILSILEPIMEYHHGEPSFVWEDKDVENMVINEELHFAVVGKFAYGMPDFHELKKQIPLQLELKGECSIGFLESRHVLIRLSLLEDYVHLLSRPAFYIKIGNRLHQLRGFKYEVWFDPKEETSIGVAWISFPGLPPVFFGKEALFSLTRAVGRPLQLDAATEFKTRPSCAKVKVEVDLVAHRPQRIRIGIKNSTNSEIKYKWIRVKYDYIPKYCKECKLQGHDEVECYTLHPELMPKEEQEKVTTMASKEMNVKGSSSLTKEATMKVLQSGKVVGNVSKDADAGVAAQVQGNQAKCATKFIHPNRNPNAWTRVDSKKKQMKNGDNPEIVSISNAFELLQDGMEADNLDGENIQDKQTQQVVMDLQCVQGTTVDAVQEEGVSTKLNDDVAGKNLIIDSLVDTRQWAATVFKEHPKNHIVGEVVVSGKDAIITCLGDDVSGLFNEEVPTGDALEHGSTLLTRNGKVQQNKVEDGRIILKDVASLSHDEKGPAYPILNDATAGKVNAHVPAVDDHMLLIPTEGGRPHASHFNDLFKDKTEGGAHELEKKQERDLMANTKQATAQAFEAEGLGLENELAMQKYPERDLIPTAHLKRLCKNASLNLGKPYLNINAPSFLPKSILQIAPHSKRLPSDSELIKQMDWHDTKGILARQVMFIHDEPRQTNYLVEDDDIFEEEELDEESTVYNFSIVAREGDLSPRPIRDKAIKKIMKERRPLEPTRVQPSRSTKSKKYKDWKNSKK